MCIRDSPQPREDHAARHDSRVDPPRDVAVVARVALNRIVGPVIVREILEVLGLVDPEAQVGDHSGLLLVGDIDDASGTHFGPAAELVDLHQVRVALDRDWDGVLRDAHRVPLQAGDLAHGRVRDPGLDLRRVEDDQPRAGAGYVRAVAVIAYRQTVRVVVAQPDREGKRRVGDIHGHERLGRGRR